MAWWLLKKIYFFKELYKKALGLMQDGFENFIKNVSQFHL